MKRLEELTYYEILEIPVRASSFEIREAYRDALSIYSEDSLSTYAFFDDEERKRVLDKIEEAYATLADENKRAEYERRLVRQGRMDSSLLREKEPKKPIPIFQVGQSKSREAFVNRIRQKVKADSHDEGRRTIVDKEQLTGEDLKHFRESVGLSLEEVFELTRINVSILKAIEGNLYEGLPAMIYLKSFIKSYAQVLALDPESTLQAYLKSIPSGSTTV
jgi:DnaJ-class molecular chaperone